MNTNTENYIVHEYKYTQDDIEHTHESGRLDGIIVGMMYGVILSCVLAIGILYQYI